MRRWMGMFAVLLSMVLPALSAAPATEDSTKPLAVWFFADWCTNCRLIAPNYEAARAGFEDRIRFVKLDLTDDSARARSRATAAALGFPALYYSNQATGWVALLDAKRRQVGELRYDGTVEDMRAALEKLARGD